MGSKKKVNPNRRPASQADVRRAKEEAVLDTATLIFTVLLDKHGWTEEQLQALWNQVENLSDSVAKGRVSMEDLHKVLQEEYNLVLSR